MTLPASCRLSGCPQTPLFLHSVGWLAHSSLGDVGDKFYIIIQGRVSVRVPPEEYQLPSADMIARREQRRQEREEARRVQEEEAKQAAAAQQKKPHSTV